MTNTGSGLADLPVPRVLSRPLFVLNPGILVNHLHLVYVYMLNASQCVRACATNEVAMTAVRLNTRMESECCGGLAGEKANPTPAYPLRF